MDELKDTISKNLVELRTQAHLTQLQLAEMLNYSDKAVSKWERGEAIPDLRVLMQLAEIYGITLDEIVSAKNVTVQTQPTSRLTSKRVFVVALSVLLVWFVATGIYALLYFFNKTDAYAYLVFVVAPLPTAILLTVFSVKWGNKAVVAVSNSLILWSCVLICHIYVMTFTDFKKIYFLYIVAAVFELLIILWFAYRWFISKRSK